VKRIVTYVFLAAVMSALSMNAGAATLSLSPGATVGSPVPGAISSVNNAFLGPGNLLTLPSVVGYFGSTVNYSVIGPGSITIHFYGGEAGFNDQLLYNSGSGFVLPAGFGHSGVPTTLIASSLAAPLATFTAGLTGSGVLPFEYMVNGAVDGAIGGPVNGANPLNLPGLPPNFFAACGPLDSVGPPSTVCGDTVWLFLDDNGKGDDDDYDDYVVRIRVSDRPVNIPEPGSLVLISSSLLGLGLAWRKFKN